MWECVLVGMWHVFDVKVEIGRGLLPEVAFGEVDEGARLMFGRYCDVLFCFGGIVYPTYHHLLRGYKVKFVTILILVLTGLLWRMLLIPSKDIYDISAPLSFHKVLASSNHVALHT